MTRTARHLLAAALAVPLAACPGFGGSDPGLYQGLAQSDVALASRLVQSTLESAPDGATRRWDNQHTGNSGTITPTRTYLSSGGYFCREYREELNLGETSGQYFHTACRDDEARWVWL